MFCAWSRLTNKGNREQKPITKKLAEFHNQFVLSTMAKDSILYNLQQTIIYVTLMVSDIFACPCCVTISAVYWGMGQVE